MMILVVPGISSRKALRILASVAVSTALVESSRISTLGLRSRARAMVRRCFWPPDTLVPPCSIQVLYLSGKRSMNSSAQASFAMRMHSSSLAFASPQRRLSRMVPLNSTFFCSTMDTSWRRTSRL